MSFSARLFSAESTVNYITGCNRNIHYRNAPRARAVSSGLFIQTFSPNFFVCAIDCSVMSPRLGLCHPALPAACGGIRCGIH